MFKYPNDLFSKLEFDKILKQISTYCKSEMASDECLFIRPSDSYKLVKTNLLETFSFLQIYQNDINIPISAFQDILVDIKMLSKEGYILEPESVLKIQKVLIIAESLRAFFNTDKIKAIEALQGFIFGLHDLNLIIRRINIVYDEEGELRPNASPELLKISKLIVSKNRELDKIFTGIVTHLKQQDMLTDTVESYRNGRRVLSVPAENKRKIRGIIHDESATGKTAFIEPENVIDINNQIFDLETDKKKEVYRILRELCADIRPYGEEIVDNYKQLIKVDIVAAKARFAQDIEATLPILLDEPTFSFKQAVHPYLFIKNSKEGKITVPFDLELIAPNRLLLLSGPNAGGKSVTMKAVGLLQIMTQSGILPTVNENSKVGVFKKIFCDIGDQQSLEDDLSTYSSRLTHMVNFINKVDKNSLILIDEFGSGTDPKIGGAIAEALLKELNSKNVFGVITTHYSNLKFFAFKTKGIVNGGMLFDKEHLEPSYELRIGKPGSSFAFEIAEKTGLPKRLLKYARFKTGKNEKAIDELLNELQSDKQLLEEKLEVLANKEKDLDRLTQSYNQLQKELDYRRKRIKLDIKEQMMAAENKANVQIEQFLKDLKKQKDLEKAKKKVAERKSLVTENKEEVKTLKKEIFYREEFSAKDFEVGQYAKMREAGTSGMIVSINKDVAELAIGSFTMKVPISGLEPTAAPIQIKRHKNVITNIDKKDGFMSKIDIRGYTLTDGVAFVQELVEQAMIRNVDLVTILHGKGSGKLKQAVHKKLKEYPTISKVWHPNDDFGGEGVTCVRL